MNLKMHVERVPLDKLTISKWNPRIESIPTEEKLKEFAKNIKKISVLSPIIVNKKYEILAGGLRWRAMQLAGFKEAEVLVYDTEAIAKELGESVDMVEAIIAISSDLYKFELRTSEKGGVLERVRGLGTYNLADIAEKLGCSVDTLWRWYQAAGVPLELKKGLEPQYKKLSSRKKLKVREIVKSIPEEHHAQLLNLAQKATLRELENVAKDINVGAPIDFEWRTKHAAEDTELVQYRIPKVVMAQFRSLCKKYDKDPYQMFVEAIKYFIQEENFKKLLEQL
jgi:ParB/RepB/Spo0J family partition protein